MIRLLSATEAVHVKLRVANPSEKLELVMREVYELLSGAMHDWCTLVCNHTLFPDEPSCSKTD